MGPIPRAEGQHALCIPFPAQGHINPMLTLAKLLHCKGFHVTFVNTEFNHRRLLKSNGLSALHGLPGFRFATIPDGLPDSDSDSQDIAALCHSTSTTCLEPLCSLILEINSSSGPPVSCILSDGVMSFTLKAAETFGLPEVLFWTTSACGFLGYTQFPKLVHKGYVPLQGDMRQVTNGYLETVVDWIPGMKNIRLKDLPSFIRTTDPKDFVLNFPLQEAEAVPRAKALILNTFDALEQDVLNALSDMFARVYTVGPLQLLTKNQVHDPTLDSITSSLWKEDLDCIAWLDSKAPESILYVNFGSVTVVTTEQLTEFAWGLANSKKPFLWVMRPDISAAMVPPEFVEETRDRSMLISWCRQEQVLKHPAIGGFLTHSGWNSTLEGIINGVPLICWPFFAEQQTNCRFSCVEWEMGMEIDSNVKRDEVELLVRELMDGGDKGNKMKEKAMEWRKKAEAATVPGGSSYLNLDKLINEVLLLH